MQCLCTRTLHEICRTSLKISRRVLLKDLCSWPLGKISATDLYALSLYKISIGRVPARSLYEDLCEGSQIRSLFKLSLKDLWTRSLLSVTRFPHKISITGLLARSPQKNSTIQSSVGPVGKISRCKRSLGKISGQDLRKRALGKSSVQAPYKDVSWQDVRARCLVLCEMLRFVRDCAVEMHMGMSQEPFYIEKSQGKCRTRRIPPRIPPQNGHTVRRKTEVKATNCINKVWIWSSIFR